MNNKLETLNKRIREIHLALRKNPEEDVVLHALYLDLHKEQFDLMVTSFKQSCGSELSYAAWEKNKIPTGDKCSWGSLTKIRKKALTS